ncbi:glucosyltransferase domain-containing protein [Chryseomicrobium sp. FSL W7-1435]|uniref:glucosyltransferase domain-containing protein n=1 Tax=Chryseomicrobium sp. FSL W7-1435 TaxID=2921704 RepID=UPI003159C0E9
MGELTVPEDYLNRLKKRITPEWKKGFLATWIIGLLTHLIIFTQYIPNHDGLVNTYADQLNFGLGRFFLGPVSWVGSYFDLSMINGLLSLFYMSLFVVVLIELFSLKKTLSIYLLAGVLVTFPVITSTFAYMFTADAYIFGYFLTGLALLVTVKWRFGFIPGALLFYVAVGIYQANLPFALTLAIVVVIHMLLDEKNTFKLMSFQLARMIATVVGGMGLYAITFFLYQRFSSSIRNYQGLNEIGERSDSIRHLLTESKDDFLEFFIGGFVTDIPVTLFHILNLLVLVLLIGFVAANAMKKSVGRTALIAVAILLLPFFTYSLYFVSPGVVYHVLMIMSIINLYFLVIVFYEHATSQKVLAWLSVGVLALTIANSAIIANISYLHLQLRFEKTTQFANRVMARIESQPEYTRETKIGIVGRYSVRSSVGSGPVSDRLPQLTGIVGESILILPYQFNYFFDTVLGTPVKYASSEELNAIKETQAFEEMPTWPREGAVEMIDGIVIIKFQEQ